MTPAEHRAAERKARRSAEAQGRKESWEDFCRRCDEVLDDEPSPAPYAEDNPAREH